MGQCTPVVVILFSFWILSPVGVLLVTMGLQHLVGGGEGCVKGDFSDIKFLSMSACLLVCMPVHAWWQWRAEDYVSGSLELEL